MFVNEANTKWQNIIKEELGVENSYKLNWMAKYAQNHEIKEGLQNGNLSPDAGIYTTPLNTLGMANPMAPTGVGFNPANGQGNGTGIGNTGADFHAYNYGVGSGDIPMSTLTMSLEIAAQTIGFELVPVVPANGPWAMLQYLDFPYAGGKLGKINETSLDGFGPDEQNKPIYIKISASYEDLKKFYDADDVNKLNIYDDVEFENAEGGKFHGKYIGKSRIDNSIIVRVMRCHDNADKDISVADLFSSAKVTVLGQELNNPHVDLVSGAADHVQEFANFFGNGKTGKDFVGSEDPMTRAQNETGVGNTIGARLYTKMVQMGSYEVTGSVTRQQLQDMPMYGIDVVGKVLEAMQNEISQSINNRILDRLFRLGVTNARNQKLYQGVDLNLYFAGAGAPATKELKDFSAAKKFKGIDDVAPGQNSAETWGPIQNAIKNTSAENVYTHQRRIMSRVLAAANLIANVSRFGRGNWVVTNTQVLSALQDASGFVIAPMVNTLVQDGSQSLYFAGSLAGLNVYVDPYMTWDDTRVLVGRKSNGETPGVIFMPYILADTVQITAEGTMAPKLLINSRFAIVDAGFHPEQSYFAFMIDTEDGFII